jgi:hypothetical protein
MRFFTATVSPLEERVANTPGEGFDAIDLCVLAVCALFVSRKKKRGDRSTAARLRAPRFGVAGPSFGFRRFVNSEW